MGELTVVDRSDVSRRESRSESEEACIMLMGRLLHGNILLIPLFAKAVTTYVTENIDLTNPTKESVNLILIRGIRLMDHLNELSDEKLKIDMQKNNTLYHSLLCFFAGLSFTFNISLGVTITLHAAQSTSAYKNSVESRKKTFQKCGLLLLSACLAHQYHTEQINTLTTGILFSFYMLSQ